MKSLVPIIVMSFFCGEVGWCRAADDTHEDAIKTDKTNLVGTWKVMAAEVDGEKVPKDILRGEVVRWVFTADAITTKVNDEIKDEDRYSLDPTKKPKTIDLTDKKGKQLHCIYLLDGDSLNVCWTEGAKDRPSEFVTKPKSGSALFIFQREKR